jgi:hypothetical protein
MICLESTSLVVRCCKNKLLQQAVVGEDPEKAAQ